jgi:hypothetical protein
VTTECFLFLLQINQNTGREPTCRRVLAAWGAAEVRPAFVWGEEEVLQRVKQGKKKILYPIHGFNPILFAVRCSKGRRVEFSVPQFSHLGLPRPPANQRQAKGDAPTFLPSPDVDWAGAYKAP